MDITTTTLIDIHAAGGPIPWAEARRAERRAEAPTWADGFAVLATSHLPARHPARRAADEVRAEMDAAATGFDDDFRADVCFARMLVD